MYQSIKSLVNRCCLFMAIFLLLSCGGSDTSSSSSSFFYTDGGELYLSNGSSEGSLFKRFNFATRSITPDMEYVALNGHLFFRAYGGLWRSDGSESGTEEIYSGEVRNLAVVDDNLYFISSVFDGEKDTISLFKSDGTEFGTQLVKDFYSGNDWVYVDELIALQDTLYFSFKNSSQSTYELWKSDGEEANTILLKSVSDVSIVNLTAGQDKLYFSMGSELWESDGSESGTALVSDLVDFIRNIGVFTNSLLVVTSNDDETNLWSSDGTSLGTELFTAIEKDGYYTPTYTSDFTVLGDKAFFRIRHNYWVSDGTDEGTIQFLNDEEGFGDSMFVSSDDETIYFTRQNSSNCDLWKTDGTGVGTSLLDDSFDCNVSSGYFFAVAVEENIYLWELGEKRNRLYHFDTQSESLSTIVENVNSSGASVFGSTPIYSDGKLFFLANDSSTGTEFWVSDGTSEGTYMIKDMGTESAGSSVSFLTEVGEFLYFTAGDIEHGDELWKSDGTEAGTQLVKDITPGPESSTLYNLTDVDGELFFTLSSDSDITSLWKSDGSDAGTQKLSEVLGDFWNLTVVNGELYFTGADDSYGAELWKSDGTESGTILVKDIVAGEDSSSPSNLTNVAGTLLFLARDTDNKLMLWKSDGTISGTVPVSPLAFGTIDELLVVGDTLFFLEKYFLAENEYVVRLWKSDGTESGTVLVSVNEEWKATDRNWWFTSDHAITSINNDAYYFINERLYKVNDDGLDELYHFDNKELLSLSRVGDKIIFALQEQDEVNGISIQLWISDGTEDGTNKLQGYSDIKVNSDYPQYSRVSINEVAGDRVLINISYLADGELDSPPINIVTDGSEAGTVQW